MHPARRFLFVILLVAFGFASEGLAAPHLGWQGEKCISHVGSLSPRVGGETISPLSLGSVSAPKFLFLRVDFPADADIETTGTGEWSDPDYAYLGDADYWVNKNRDDLIAYYAEVSRGQLQLSIEISPEVYRLPETMAFYGTETDAAVESLIYDAVTTAQASALDLSAYDAIYVVHAGAGEETDVANGGWGDSHGDIWSLYYDDTSISYDDRLYSPSLKINGALVTEAVIMPQTGIQDGMFVDSLGIYAHETGHLFGLPDLYPTNFFSISAGVGSWCLMGDGLYNQAGPDSPLGSSPAWLSAWCRTYLGWEVPMTTPLDADPGTLSFWPVEDGPLPPGEISVLKLPAIYAGESAYFLLENRQRIGFDAGLEGGGLLVWRIDEETIAATIGRNAVNNLGEESGVVLVEADGDASLMSPWGVADSGDPFPGTENTQEFSPMSVPASSDSVKGPACVNLKAIQYVNNTVTCDVGLGPAPADFVQATFYDETVELDWDAPLDPTRATFNVYRNGELIATTTLPYYADYLGNGTDTYWVSSEDFAGNETLDKTPITPVSLADSDGGGGRCFIATAAYGSYEAPALDSLRRFRDQVLLPNAAGKFLVKKYYEWGPHAAKKIERSDFLKFVVRVALVPLIGLALFCVELSFAQQLACCLSLGLLVMLRAERRRRGIRMLPSY